MIQVTGPHTLGFFPVDLDFITRAEVDAFARKNNKTVAETLAHERYSQLKPIILERYSEALTDPPGSFLQELKPTGDPLYLQFLNSRGNRIYFHLFSQLECRTYGPDRLSIPPG